MNIDHTLYETEKYPNRSCALLWDESFLWGLMAWRALKEAGLPFDLLRSEDIREGALSRYRMLFVPGGGRRTRSTPLGIRGGKRSGVLWREEAIIWGSAAVLGWQRKRDLVCCRSKGNLHEKESPASAALSASPVPGTRCGKRSIPPCSEIGRAHV